MPEVKKYDETSDLQEHITTYITSVKGNDLAPHEIKSVLLKIFGETLTRGALTWYSLFPEHSIDSFKMLADSFINAHAGARKADVHNQYESKIRIEDDQVGFPLSTKGWEKNREKMKNDIDMDRRTSRGRFLPYERTEGRGRSFRTANKFTIERRTDRGRNNRSLHDREILGSRDSSFSKLSKHNFNVSMVELVSAMRNIKEARFSRPMKSDPSQRDPNLWCEYHGTNSHQTGNCRHLREEVATLLKNVDPGSSANIIQWRVLEQAKLTGSIIPATKLLAGFNLASVTTRGEILLLTNAKGVMKTTLFEVVNGDMWYNIILGRPWLHEMKVVPSTYHQLLKFLTPKGIKQIRGDQPTTREMSAISVSSNKRKERAV
ncbi:uncharacterized protein [Nicotiana tomentosiformis]|uniref:uncharacterized protein n=1 Tax=Nicotiana tomentosiformis TaxID=4098 RepID=UPI00388C7BC8